jgi:hypothetical protein
VEPDKQLEGGGLAGAVRPQIAQDLAATHLEIELLHAPGQLHRPGVAVLLRQTSGLDRELWIRAAGG